MERTEVDIKENSVMELDSELLAILLQDKNSGKNLLSLEVRNESSESGYA